MSFLGSHNSIREHEKGSVGLYYFNARYYDAKIGRFISEDVAKAGVSWYAYCDNNPLTNKDPTGLAPFRAGAVLDGCAGGYASTPVQTPPKVKLPEVPGVVGDAAGFAGPLLAGISEQKRSGAIAANKVATLDYLAGEPGAAAAVKSTAKAIDAVDNMGGTGKALGILGWGLTAYSEVCAAVQSITSQDLRPIIKTTVTNGLEIGGSIAGSVYAGGLATAATVETLGATSPLIPAAAAAGGIAGTWAGRTVSKFIFDDILGWK